MDDESKSSCCPYVLAAVNLAVILLIPVLQGRL